MVYYQKKRRFDKTKDKTEGKTNTKGKTSNKCRFTREQYRSGQHALSGDEAKKLLLTFDDIGEKALIALGMAIGARREDLVAIKARDFHPENDGMITYYESKKKRTRTVFIPSQETIQLLQMHLKVSRRSDWLFPSPRLTPHFRNRHMSGRHAYNILDTHLEQAGLEPRPFHALRATCYKLAQARGWTPRMACELLGDSLEVAEMHYDAPSVGEMRAMASEKQLF
jgi:integrase